MRVERAIGLVEATADAHGIENAVQTSIGVTDGERLWAVRYSTERQLALAVRVEDASAIRALHPENPRLQRMRDEDRVVVSEPISDLPGVWQEIPESTVADRPTAARRATLVPPALRARRRAPRPLPRPHAERSSAIAAPPQEAGSSRLSLVLAAAMFVLVVDTSLMNVSIAAVVEDLDTTVSSVQSAIALEALVSAAFILISSKIGDLFGRKRAFVAGSAGVCDRRGGDDRSPRA